MSFLIRWVLDCQIINGSASYKALNRFGSGLLNRLCRFFRVLRLSFLEFSSPQFQHFRPESLLPSWVLEDVHLPCWKLLQLSPSFFFSSIFVHIQKPMKNMFVSFIFLCFLCYFVAGMYLQRSQIRNIRGKFVSTSYLVSFGIQSFGCWNRWKFSALLC